MKDGKQTPKMDKKKKQEEISTSGKKLVQARLPFKILPQSPKPPQTSIDSTVSNNAVRSQSIDSIENTDIRKRKLSYSSDNDTAVTKILKTNSQENEKLNAYEIVISTDNSDDSSTSTKSSNSKQSSAKEKFNSKLVIKLPICSKKKRKKKKEHEVGNSSNNKGEIENPTKKLKSIESSKEAIEVDAICKIQYKIENDVIIIEPNLDNPQTNCNETSAIAKPSDEVSFLIGNKSANNCAIENVDQVDDNTIKLQHIKVCSDLSINKNQTIEIDNENQKAAKADISLNATSENLDLSSSKKSDKLLGKKSEKELQRQKQKDEKERQKRLEKEEKEEKEAQRKRERDEKEEFKRKEKDEKEKKRLAEIELKNEEKRLKEDERRKKEDERKKREDEKRKKEVEKEEAENKKKKAAQAFTKFFVQSRSNPKVSAEDEQNSLDSCKSENRFFMPFRVKGDMTLAPIVRKSLSPAESKNLEKYLSSNVYDVKDDLYLSGLKSAIYKPGISSKTLSKNIAESDEVMIIENELQDVGQLIDDTTKLTANYRAKYFLFHENRRPPYYGTWRKKSSMVTPRKPLSMDKVVFDYEVDSDDEWEEEEAGESLRGSEDEKESEDEYEVDNDFFVPHGHLSDEELLNDDEIDDNSAPENQKAKLKILQQEFAQEMKKKTEKIKPKLYGIFWADENGNQPESCPDIMWNSLNKRAMIFTEPFLLKSEIFDEAGTSPKQNEKKIKITEFPEKYIEELIKLTHGNRNKKKFIINEFLAHITQKLQTTEDEEKNINYTKKSIQDKIHEIAVWKAYLDESQSKKKTLCWIIYPEILAKYNLNDLSIVNNWSYILHPKSKQTINESNLATKK